MKDVTIFLSESHDNWMPILKAGIEKIASDNNLDITVNMPTYLPSTQRDLYFNVVVNNGTKEAFEAWKAVMLENSFMIGECQP